MGKETRGRTAGGMKLHLPILACTVFCFVGIETCVSQDVVPESTVQPAAKQPAGSSSNALARMNAPRQQVSAYVRKVFRDRDGNLWLGTNDEGVGRFDGAELRFFGPQEGLAGRAVRGIVQDQAGDVWIACDAGVSRYRQGVLTTFKLGETVADNDAWSLLLDHAGTLWVGTRTGVRRFDAGTFTPFTLPAATTPIGSSLVAPGIVLDMHQDQAGNIWFATDGAGLYRYDGTAFLNYSTADGLGSNQVLCVHADRRGRIWLGTNGGGVTRIDGAAIQTWSSADGLGNDRVWDLMEDRQGVLWFATLGAGVTRFDGTAFTTYGQERGLTAGHVQNIFEDHDGTLWLGCSGGLFRREGDGFVNVTRDGSWNSEPLEAFSRFIGGSWKMTTSAGRDTFDTWTWGPGMQSMRSMRVGALTDGEPWTTMSVYFWHPTLKEVRLLSVGSVRRGIGEGRIAFDGDSAESVFTLKQSSGTRHLMERWTFTGPGTYRDELSERVGSEYEVLSAWDRARVDAVKPDVQVAIPLLAPSSTPSELMHPLARVLGSMWASIAAPGGSGSDDDEPRIRTSFDYVPNADMILGRVEMSSDDNVSSHAMDIYLYHDTGTRMLRCLGLHGDPWNGPSVYEGDIAPASDGESLTMRMTEHRSSGQRTLESRIDFEKNSRLRLRVWSRQDQELTLIVDRRHGRAQR